MRIIIAGSRDFNDYSILRGEVLNVLKKLKSKGYSIREEDIEIISGTARGADQLGEIFAEEFGLSLSRFRANWDEFGKRAGYLRNAEMSKYAKQDEEVGVLVAFWNGSRGTKHMIDLANRDGLEVYVINFLLEDGEVRIDG